MLLRFPLEPLLSFCAPDVRRAARELDHRQPQQLVLTGTSWAEAGLGLQIFPSLPWPLEPRAWRFQQLSRDIPTGLVLAPLREESLQTPSGWPLTVILAALCEDPQQVATYRQERIGYFFTLLDSVAAVVLYVRDRAAYQRVLPGLTQVLKTADGEWEAPELAPATLSQLWAAPSPTAPSPTVSDPAPSTAGRSR